MAENSDSNNRNKNTVSLRGVQCFVHHFNAKAETPKALVVIFHGYAAHGKYPTVRYAAEFLMEAGFAVIAIDFPGHGKSDGVRGYFESAEMVIADGVTMVEHAQSLYPGLKLFLVGSSMGGSIALSVANSLSSNATIAGVILLAPMLKLKVSAIERYFLSGLAFVLPKVRLIPSSATDAKKQYREPTKREECENDELTCGGKLRPSTAKTLVDITCAIQEQFKSTNCPFLVMIADEDVVVNNEGSEEFFEQCASTDKTKKHYAALHGLLCEPSPLFEEIKNDMLSWINERA
mmetsp:Transcript_22122/g.32673  ORF Transcript_22122/g.32673 Transcript_22122/m.32673 type:complete len:291 (-) Transcript_22122:78-950(-)|eukprot:CAMPEP_0194259352 /NCGR_PEP_ID=MMETSP0158-20130606/43405_1 /TAXON_ID=33649 /ORGANISM="Thalassionema nitzschioides, Strain L26-B" /LENGTH=290 /DNA_ID=CAMNT_0038999127 /DNA_START=138 /DNA_END=1010 /DNA_ORIENTATION=+